MGQYHHWPAAGRRAQEHRADRRPARGSAGADRQAMRQRLQQCVVVSPWDAGELFARLARTVDRELPDVAAFVVDDTGFPKKGHPLGRRRAPVLGHAGPDRQLPSGHESASGGRARERLHGDAAVFTRGVDRRPRAVPDGGRARHGRVCPQMATRPGAAWIRRSPRASAGMSCWATRPSARSRRFGRP